MHRCMGKRRPRWRDGERGWLTGYTRRMCRGNATIHGVWRAGDGGGRSGSMGRATMI